MVGHEICFRIQLIQLQVMSKCSLSNKYMQQDLKGITGVHGQMSFDLPLIAMGSYSAMNFTFLHSMKLSYVDGSSSRPSSKAFLKMIFHLGLNIYACKVSSTLYWSWDFNAHIKYWSRGTFQQVKENIMLLSSLFLHNIQPSVSHQDSFFRDRHY